MFYGVCVYVCLGFCCAHALCDLEPRQMKGSAWQQAEVRRVLDGDTLELADGARVRMVGVNAPETAKHGKPGDPLGNGAWRQLESLVKSGDFLYFRRDRTHQDRYGRQLLHPFTADGRNLTAQLLTAGWGFHVVIPPNNWQADCYRNAELNAIQKRRGVWGLSYYDPIDSMDFERLRGGYSRVAGRVESVTLTRASAWVELVGQVSIKVAKQDLKDVDGKVWQRLLEASQQGQFKHLPTLEVHGWMSDRRDWGDDMRKQIANGVRKVFQFKVRHRYDWQLLDAIHSD